MSCSVYISVKKCPVSTRYIVRVVDTVLKKLQTAGDISVHCVGERRIRTLNHLHRGKDRATDVLSFSSLEGQSMPGVDKEIGDIFLCVPYIERQARRFGVSVQEECTRMLVHGILHALGYDHMRKQDADIMFPLQETLIQKCIS